MAEQIDTAGKAGTVGQTGTTAQPGTAVWGDTGNKAPTILVSGFGLGPPGGARIALTAAKRRAPPPPRRLAMFGLTALVAEPVAMLAEILGWEVVCFPSGPAVCPPARLCLAMLPETGAGAPSPVVAWSPDMNLNEHISRSGLSIMDQPLCIANMEKMLLSLSGDL